MLKLGTVNTLLPQTTCLWNLSTLMQKYRGRNTCLVSFKSSHLFFKPSTPTVRCSRRTAHVQWGTFIWVNLDRMLDSQRDSALQCQECQVQDSLHVNRDPPGKHKLTHAVHTVASCDIPVTVLSRTSVQACGVQTRRTSPLILPLSGLVT